MPGICTQEAWRPGPLPFVELKIGVWGFLVVVGLEGLYFETWSHYVALATSEPAM